MKFAKLFMAIAVVCLAVACTSPEKQVEKAQKHVEKKEWVKAAEALAKIDPADMAEEVVKKTPLAKKVKDVGSAIIYSSDNQEAEDIVEKWGDEVRAEMKKLVKE